MVKTPIPLELILKCREQPIRGKITHLIINQLEVKITDPAYNVTSGLHIPYFGLEFKRFVDKDSITPYGNECARQILETLYYSCTFIENNMEEVKRKYDAYLEEKKKIEAENVSDEKLKMGVIEMRAKFREGGINPKDHQRELGKLRKANNDYHSLIAISEQRFNEGFPRCIYLTLEIVGKMLK